MYRYKKKKIIFTVIFSNLLSFDFSQISLKIELRLSHPYLSALTYKIRVNLILVLILILQ